MLMAYPWPGNIRELRNGIAPRDRAGRRPPDRRTDFSATVLHGQTGRQRRRHAGRTCSLPQAARCRSAWTRSRAMVLRETLLRHRWNRTRAAAGLGLSRASSTAPSCSASSSDTPASPEDLP